MPGLSVSRVKPGWTVRGAPSLTGLCVLMVGCGGGGGGESTTAPPVVDFGSLSLSPLEAVVCLAEGGNVVALSAVPRDQNGQPMSAMGSPSFTSSNAGAATVAASGLVRAVAPGSSRITASLTAAGTTHTASASITVASAVVGNATGTVANNHPAPHIGVITAAQLSAGNPLSLSIQGQAFHSHTLNLADVQVRLIAAGCQVSQASSSDPHSDGSGAHIHTVTFN